MVPKRERSSHLDNGRRVVPQHAPDLAQGGGMEVLCACDERYLPHLATMLCSLLMNNTVFRVHLFYSSLDDRELLRLQSFVRNYGSSMVWYEINTVDLPDLRVDQWVSIATYYRLLAPRILPVEVDKILYLDSDIIVRRSLTELWKSDLSDHALAAVENQGDAVEKAVGWRPVGTRYFNAGVLLINLKFWRQNSVSERAIAFIRNNPEKVTYWDQDALNAILVDRWIELPAYWNSQGIGKDPAIVHFTGGEKPWHWSLEHPFKSEYHKYRVKTPWPQYKLEGKPGLPHILYACLRGFVGFLRSFARTMLPASLRQWLRFLASSRT
jgi:lipopolysaccharide biosynthesis glycosyltransferase